MKLREARHIFKSVNSEEFTDFEKVRAIGEILGLVTHMSVTKDEITTAFRWLYDKVAEER